ncbi:hypothetical protein RJ639_029147 [Escallonia herrerae]|uniref:DNA 3'-5' helicase n=1 Tax=Escallonia herrerae TaxID=1293975 RepID=A0AA88X6F1_9ASTE|nr:hypothetical protein RJ639_029147 [Escallonia herrerae]
MNSDSDSDGSHISSTPPRNHQPPPPQRQLQPPPPKPQPPPPATTLLSSYKLRTTTTTSSRPILKPKPSTKQKPKNSPPKAEEPDPLPNPSSSTIPISNLPFQIHHLSDQISTNHTSITNIIPAGCLSLNKFASFTKIRKPGLNLEPTESDPILTESEIRVLESDRGDLMANDSGEAVCSGEKVKVVKRHPNLIGSGVSSSVPVKKPKCVNEGNFVRLNINGRGRSKFTNKGKKRNPNAYTCSRKSFRRTKKKVKVGEGENCNFCDEEGIFLENEAMEELSTNGNWDLIEEAVIGVRNEASDENLVNLLKLTHGYDSFREGQLEAIKMVLAGESTMLVLPTGAGKSLCYQLPAIVLPGVTLVVSPLVALMIDQLKQLPRTPQESSETLRQLQGGALKVLFVSPERFLNAEFISILSATPLISLAVVDEAHCISEWSHNFRPSYMRLRASLLRASLGVKCLLAMTATATIRTLHDVMCALEIPPTNLIQMEQIRDNLQLMKDLMRLLKSSPFSEVRSIIIYCKFQSETEMITKVLCDSNILAKSYHSGLPAKDRSRTQELFCSNKIRVVVATVAFGMGLDKSDVGAVIHYSLAESLEEYVQEIGRAGRDGRLSYCHLLFDDNTYFKLRSLMYSDGLDEYAVNRFLSQVFSSNTDLPGKICSVVRESASRQFDMKEEAMLTILTRLELGEVHYLHLLPQMNVTCSVNFHKTAPAFLAAKDIIIAAILKKSEAKHGQYVFDIPTVANSLRVPAIDISNQLQNLKMDGEITYELKDPAYCYTIVDVPEDVRSLATDLTKWLSEVESCKVRKIDTMFNAAAFAVKACSRLHGCDDCQHTPCLQRNISEYFKEDDDRNIPNKMGQSSPFLRADIKVRVFTVTSFFLLKVFLQSNSQAKFTPRAISRIMHGIASPAYPSATWSKTHFWYHRILFSYPRNTCATFCAFLKGRYMQTDFKVIMEAAKAELLNFVGKDVGFIEERVLPNLCKSSAKLNKRAQVAAILSMGWSTYLFRPHLAVAVVLVATLWHSLLFRGFHGYEDLQFLAAFSLARPSSRSSNTASKP